MYALFKRCCLIGLCCSLSAPVTPCDNSADIQRDEQEFRRQYVDPAQPRAIAAAGADGDLTGSLTLIVGMALAAGVACAACFGRSA